MNKYILFFFLFSPLYGESMDGGFLSVNAKITGTYLKKSQTYIYTLPVWMEGNSGGFDIITEIFFNPELIHLTNYYHDDSSFIPEKNIFPYSFGSFSLQYLLMQHNFIFTHLGIIMGHHGYLAGAPYQSSHTIYTGLKSTFSLSLTSKSILKIPFELPITLYKKNIQKIWRYRTGIEILVNPLDSIITPSKSSFAISSGFDFDYSAITFQNKKEIFNFMSPFIKFSIVY